LRPDTRLALCVMPVWFAWLAIAFQFSRFKAVGVANPGHR
jgi:D-serine/D-alanine/glycine transporter